MRESVRNPANLGYAAMLTTLIGAGDVDWDEAFRGYQGGRNARTGRWHGRRRPSRIGGRGLHPMSMLGAVAAARQLVQGVVGRKKKNEKGIEEDSMAQQRRDELVRREIELAERWARAQTGNSEIVGETEQDVMSEGGASCGTTCGTTTDCKRKP
ncbi:hypothetical protein ACFQ60_09380 [Streptomyces zhihengii]